MKYNISATTFNGINIEPQIDLYIIEGCKDNKLNLLLPTKIYSEIDKRLKNEKKIENFSFTIISKDLENLKSQNIEIDSDSLIKIIYPLVLELLDKQTNDKITNQKLLRAIEFYENKEYKDAHELCEDIDIKSLETFEFSEYILLNFKLTQNKDKKDFEQAKAIFKTNPTKMKQIYFEYIKYLEDIRDEKEPNKIIKEFEEQFPISILSDKELPIYYYLKGRANYARGEFLLALKFLSLAIQKVDKTDEKLIASIYNTATNSFTDNLFFDEAKQMANKALQLREKLKLPEKEESISLLGGIYFKSTKFKKAYTYYKESNIKDKNRIFNYIAKSSIMSNYMSKYEEAIKKSNNFEDKKGFSILIQLLYLLKTKEFNNMKQLYKQTIMLPENKQVYDKFVIGWGYALMSEMSFENGKFDDAIEYLYKSIDYFVMDKYILEAFYVSLYIYKYSIDKKYMIEFNELTKSINIKEKFKLYTQKHSSISKEYSKIFKIEQSKNSNLETLFEDTKDINMDNYNPELIKNILDKYCLI